ncbi:MAG: hypothetical protein MUC47_07635 [Candidatus Kapabacteria bacterium]|jgi:hypothetical protein|nr:hypothetical protein [Candidatus Kapabacteria bacterium]
MRRYSSIIVCLLLLVSVAFAAESVLQSFVARSTGSAVQVEWRLSSEASVASFELERAGKDDVFRLVSVIQSRTGTLHYAYTDDEAFAKGDGAKAEVASAEVRYRLKLIKPDRTHTYSNAVSVTHNVSGIRRTWGMIKEMFR